MGLLKPGLRIRICFLGGGGMDGGRWTEEGGHGGRGWAGGWGGGWGGGGVCVGLRVLNLGGSAKTCHLPPFEDLRLRVGHVGLAR